MYFDVQFQLVSVQVGKSHDWLRPVLESFVVELAAFVTVAMSRIQVLEIFLVVVVVVVIERLS